MLTLRFAEAVHISGLTHRASYRADGAIIYRLADGSRDVLVDAEAWQRLSDDIREKITAVRRRTRWISIVLFPAILVFGVLIAQWAPLSGSSS